MKASKSNASIGDRIQIGRRDFSPEGAKIGPAKIVGDDQQEVRLMRCGKRRIGRSGLSGGGWDSPS